MKNKVYDKDSKAQSFEITWVEMYFKENVIEFADRSVLHETGSKLNKLTLSFFPALIVNL